MQWRKAPCAAAPNLLADSEAQARNSNREANLPGFTTAQQSDPSLPRFDPGDRFAPRVCAHELVKTAHSSYLNDSGLFIAAQVKRSLTSHAT